MDLRYIYHKYRKTQFNWGSAREQGLATFSVSPGWLGPTLQKRRWKLRIPEKISYLLATVGILGDHLSTRLGLTKPYLYESNPYTIYLMEKGLWLPFDLILLLATVGISFHIMRRWTFRDRWAVLAFPILLGSIRLCSAIWNIYLYLY